MPVPPFPVGQKVLCTNGLFQAAVFEAFSQTPQTGQIYTIAEMFWAYEHGTGENVLSVRLAEIPPLRNNRAAGFSLSRFRLVDDVDELRATIEPLALSA